MSVSRVLELPWLLVGAGDSNAVPHTLASSHLSRLSYSSSIHYFILFYYSLNLMGKYHRSSIHLFPGSFPHWYILCLLEIHPQPLSAILFNSLEFLASVFLLLWPGVLCSLSVVGGSRGTEPLSQACSEDLGAYLIPGSFPSVCFVSLIFLLASQCVSDLIPLVFLWFKIQNWLICMIKYFAFFFQINFSMIYFLNILPLPHGGS